MIAMLPLIPTDQWNALSLAISGGDGSSVNSIIGQYAVDVNSFDDSSWMPILMEVLLSYGFSSEGERLDLLHSLLKKGANPSICCSKGYNCMHIAVQQERYLPALDLFLGFEGDVNVTDADGCNLVYWAVQYFLLRKSDSDENRALSLRVLEKILLLGADLDHLNKHGMNARGWLEHAAPEVRELVARWEKTNPAVRPPHTIQPSFPLNLHYPAVAQLIWSKHVPSTGAAIGIEGQLLQAVEQLREEAQRNRNANYRKNHKRMAVFVRDTLTGSGFFDFADKELIRSETGKLMKASRPYTDDDVYDHLVDRVCLFYTHTHKETVV